MSKRKILSMALTLCMVAILAIGGTLAYYTDTDSQMNTFTTGNVAINLDEAVVKSDADDNLVDAGTRTEANQEYKLHPGMTVYKDPTITVDAESEDAYLGAIVTITSEDVTVPADGDVAEHTINLHDLIGVEGYANIDITKMASGGVCTTGSTQEQGWNGLSMVYKNNDVVIYQKAEDGKWTMYIFVEEIKSKNDEVVLFDTLTIDKGYDYYDMQVLAGMTITVDAFATQADGFDSCYEALTSAFPTEWNFA